MIQTGFTPGEWGRRKKELLWKELPWKGLPRVESEEMHEDGKTKKVEGTIQIIAHSSSLLFFKTQEVTGSDLRIVLYRISEDLMIVCYMLPGVELGNASTFVMKRISL